MFTDPGCRSERTAELVVAPGYCTARPVSAWALLAQASEELLQVPEGLPMVSVPASWSLLKAEVVAVVPEWLWPDSPVHPAASQLDFQLGSLDSKSEPCTAGSPSSYDSFRHGVAEQSDLPWLAPWEPKESVASSEAA